MHRPKPYKAKTLSGAEHRVRSLLTEVRRLNVMLHNYLRENVSLKDDRIVLAKLAASGPAFDNPLVVYEAKQLRDKILRHGCGLNPDGSFIERHRVPAAAPAGEGGES